MTLDQLRIFIAVAERLHVTQAAATLNLTQSAVSASIAALETQHDVRLFNRLGRRIELTDAGRGLVSEARAILSRVESATIQLEDRTKEIRGRLRIYASQTIASYWLPARMVALHAEHPEIELTLTAANTAQVADAVLQDAAELGFVEGMVELGALHRQEVAQDEMVMIVAVDHPWVGRKSIPTTDYKRQNWILRESGSGTRSVFEDHLSAAGLSLSDLTVSLVLPSNEAVLAAVAAGRCVSVLSKRAVQNAAKSGHIVSLSIPAARRPFAVLSHPGRYKSRASEAMLNLVTGGYRALK